LIEQKKDLMKKLGRKELRVDLQEPISAIPEALSGYDLTIEDDGHSLLYDYDTEGERTGITTLLTALAEAGIRLKDISTRQSSLEDIFVELVGARA
jgi:ABC-2 type transport system ATP-binding protein